jgi:protein-tyrosine phosphatase
MEAVNFAELHFHLLPGVDDGPATVEESIELARAAATDGTDTIVATPHVHELHITDPAEITERVEELAARLRAQRVPIEVRAGGELADRMVAHLSQGQLEAIAHGPPGRRWLLLEAPFRGMDADYRAAAEEVRARGFAVLVAHPERAMKGGAAAQAMLDHELAAGSAVQLTAWSFLGRYGEERKRHAFRILRSAPRVVLASDAHSLDRPPSLRPALHVLRAAGVPDPERLTGEVPRSLLEEGLALPSERMVA